MPRTVKPLSDTQIKFAKPRELQYKLSDGDGLYLLVKPDGVKLWRMDYTRPITKKRNTLAFGVYPDISLADARSKREEARKLIALGSDPSEQRKEDARVAKIAAANTFESVALEWLSKQKFAESTKEKSKYLLILPFLKFGHRPISEILPYEVLDVCRIAEKEGHLEKARRIRQRCSQVFRYGVALGICSSDPTRDLRGALEAPETRHHSAIVDPCEVGRLLVDIENYSGNYTTVSALKIAPMLFTRPGELRALKWADLDLDLAQWRYTPPKTKKKTGIQMIVPLASQVVGILRELQAIHGHSEYVFPAIHTKLKCMSENTINQALRRMGWEADQVCGHGFRATARTILEDVLDYPPELIEMQLGHQVKDPNGRAYNRTWKLVKRTEMMQHWADYLDDLRNGQIVQFTKATG